MSSQSFLCCRALTSRTRPVARHHADHGAEACHADTSHGCDGCPDEIGDPLPSYTFFIVGSTKSVRGLSTDWDLAHAGEWDWNIAGKSCKDTVFVEEAFCEAFLFVIGFDGSEGND